MATLPAWPLWKKGEFHILGKADSSFDRHKVIAVSHEFPDQTISTELKPSGGRSSFQIFATMANPLPATSCRFGEP